MAFFVPALAGALGGGTIATGVATGIGKLATGAITGAVSKAIAGGGPKAPSPGAAPTTADPAVQQAGAEARKRVTKGGRASTIVTGGRGVTGPAETARKVLLGA